MRILKINDQEHTVDGMLDGFNIHQKPSSNVEYFGDNGNEIFIQFKNGSCYIYKGILKEHIQQMYEADSIGKFISALSKLYPYITIKQRLVNTVIETTKP